MKEIMNRDHPAWRLRQGEVVVRMMEEIDVGQTRIAPELGGAIEGRVEFDPVAHTERARQLDARTDERPLDGRVQFGKPLQQTADVRPDPAVRDQPKIERDMQGRLGIL